MSDTLMWCECDKKIDAITQLVFNSVHIGKGVVSISICCIGAMTLMAQKS